jgi:serine protease
MPFARTALTAALLTLAAVPAAAQPAAPSPPAAVDATPNRLLVRLPGFDDRDALAEAIARIGDDLAAPLSLGRRSLLDWAVVDVDADRTVAGADLQALADRLENHPLVAGVALDRRLRAQATFDDPGIAQQHGVAALDLPRAWDITTGNPDLVVAVVDSGIVVHEDLEGVVLSGWDFVSDPALGGDGDGRDADPFDDGAAPTDCGGQEASSGFHGTMVSGVVAAKQNNGVGVAGTAQVGLTAVRALGACGGSSLDIAEAAWWAAGGQVDGAPTNPNPAQVVNLSLGGPGACDSFYQAVFQGLDDAGVVAVVAAGNSAQDTAGTTPANCPGVLTVAATDHEDYLSSFSNYGAEVDVLAPGGDISFYGQAEAGILTTVGSGPQDYTFTQGTSFSAPFVSGVVSLVLALQPSLDRAGLEQLLRGTGAPAYCPASEQYVPCDRELVDAGAAVAAAAGIEPVEDPSDADEPTDDRAPTDAPELDDPEQDDVEDNEADDADDVLAELCADPAFALAPECAAYTGAGCSMTGATGAPGLLLLLPLAWRRLRR